MIIMVRNASRKNYNLGEVLCYNKLLTKQTCNISGMGIEENMWMNMWMTQLQPQNKMTKLANDTRKI